MAQTANEIILGALRLLKVKEAGEALTADEAVDGLVALNDLIEEWNNQPLMQPAKTQLTQVLTVNDGTYTFGTGGDNSTRPERIYNAFIRDVPNNIDYPVNIISNNQYSLISFKTTTSSYPFNLYYRNDYPLGTVNLYPVPANAYTLFLEVQAAISTVSTGSTSIDLPPGYLKALKYNLAIDLSPEYKDPSMIVIQQAQKSIAWIKRMNSEDRPIMMNTARRAVRNSGNYYYLFGAS